VTGLRIEGLSKAIAFKAVIMSCLDPGRGGGGREGLPAGEKRVGGESHETRYEGEKKKNKKKKIIPSPEEPANTISNREGKHYNQEGEIMPLSGKIGPQIANLGWKGKGWNCFLFGELFASAVS